MPAQYSLIKHPNVEHLWWNCAFDDTSMKFGTQLENSIANIFGYRAIADLATNCVTGQICDGPSYSQISPESYILIMCHMSCLYHQMHS